MSKHKQKKKLARKVSSNPGIFSQSFESAKKIIKTYPAVVLSVFYFILLTIISLVFHKVGDYGVETDFFWGYVPSAKEFLNGTIKIDAFRGPLYPIILALFGLILPDYFTAGVMIGVVSASLVVYFTFELLKRLFSVNIAVFVVIILMFNPVFIQYVYSAGTDMFFNALVTATLFFFLKDEKQNYKNLIIAALLGGLSYLTRYNAIFLISFVIIILFVNYQNLKWADRLKYTAIFLAVFFLTIVPWGIYCLNEKGSFFYNENYKNIAFEIYGKEKMSWDEYWFKESKNVTSLTDVVIQDPGVFFSTVANNVGEHFINDMEILLGWHVGIFVIAGIVLLIISNPLKSWKNRQIRQDSPSGLRPAETSVLPRQAGYFISNIFFFGLLLLIFYGERFSLFLIPFYLVLAVQPFFLSNIKIKKFIPEKFSYVLMAGLIVFTFVKSYSYNKERINSGPVEILELRDWFQKNVPGDHKNKKIASRKAHVAYYLDMQFSLLPMADSYNELINKLKEMNVDYLYFSQIEASMRPQFQSLLNSKIDHPDLKVVVFFKNPPAVLYEVINK